MGFAASVPELPDVTVYVEALRRFVDGRPLRGIRLVSPFLVRTFDPPVAAAAGRTVRHVSRIGKRILFELDDDLFLVVHLMIAGRFHWKRAGAPLNAKTGLASLDFDHGSLFITETSSKKRAALHLVRGKAALVAFQAGGIEPLECSVHDFRQALVRENHTLKRALTDPTIIGGVGNAYSDEILHRAKLSPMTLTSRLDHAAFRRLHAATQSTLREWIDRLRRENGDGFPEQVTAFREGMAVHGRHGKPCPVCATAVQRIRYAENETNYCPSCQTDGKLLADRALSRLLRDDWPKTVDELERRRTG